MFEGFTLERVDLGEVTLRVRHGGTGTPVVLIHGHPRTHTTWHEVAPVTTAARSSPSAPPWTTRAGFLRRGRSGRTRDDLDIHGDPAPADVAEALLAFLAGHGRPR